MFSSGSHHSPYPIQHAFVVQFEAKTGLDAGSISGRIEHIVSGQATQFQSLVILVEFVTQVLREIQESDHDSPLA